MKFNYIVLLSMLLYHLSMQTKDLEQPLLTTTIGAWPKPAYISLPDWFSNVSNSRPSSAYEEYLSSPDSQETLDRATHEVVHEQVTIDIDIPTDGEIQREHYIYYHCRHLDGIDFLRLTKKEMRNGSWVAYVPTIVSSIKAGTPFLPRDLQIAQAETDRPIKVTIPGPMTITDSTADDYYHDEEKLGAALADAINQEVRALINAGCTWIQIDEPVFARKPAQALAYGIRNLERCFAGVPDNVITVVHICCGYPQRADMEKYPKADPHSYLRLADALDASSIKAVSIEDAHHRNDPKLFGHFKNTMVILGVIDISKSRVEPVEEIKDHIQQVLAHIPANRLMIAPDCGLGLLKIDVVKKKLYNMVQAVSLLKKST